MSNNPDPFDSIHATLQGTPTRRGWYDATCPNCGKEVAKGQVHFGYNAEGAGKCFCCSWSGGPNKLAELLRIEIGEYVAPVRVERPAPELARWRLNPYELLRRYNTHPGNVARWQAYKPLSAETIERHGLGYGPLPFQRDNGDWYMSRSDWLIVPIYQDGALVALRGRNTGDRGPKWISATGSEYAFWNVENVPAGAICWLTENYVDAIWLMQYRPDWWAVAIGGATTWRSEWAKQLAARKPSLVIVALDCDLPGNGGGHLRDELIAEWIATHPGAQIPKANGPAITNDLLRLGMTARLFEWPADAPAKAGVDWLLAESQQEN